MCTANNYSVHNTNAFSTSDTYWEIFSVPADPFAKVNVKIIGQVFPSQADASKVAAQLNAADANRRYVVDQAYFW